jgi:hypothetical protein
MNMIEARSILIQGERITDWTILAGRGAGEREVFSIDYFPLPSIPSRQGRGRYVSLEA